MSGTAIFFQIFDNIVTDLLGLEPPANQNECFDLFEKTVKKHPDDRLYLLIHNLDGGMLRSHKAQDVLSRLASIPNIHVLASVDHINAPLSNCFNILVSNIVEMVYNI